MQQRLRQAIGAESQPDQGMILTTGHVAGIDGEHRQDQKHPQHTQGIQTGQPGGGTKFKRGHGQQDKAKEAILTKLTVSPLSMHD
ncbi:hypothetical protein JHS3_19250 [Jeongeupia sp. HS-3]|nr:hypothetical protein JHS3_19250 [Jeongeupia sp. HS-3]